MFWRCRMQQLWWATKWRHGCIMFPSSGDQEKCIWFTLTRALIWCTFIISWIWVRLQLRFQEFWPSIFVHITLFPGVFSNLVSESRRRGSRKRYLHHRCSPGLSTHWQPHKACLETDDNATKTTQVAADHLEEKCSVWLRYGVTAERSKSRLKEREE